MNVLALIVRELMHRWGGFCLAVLAVAASVALYVAFATTNDASFRETSRIMRDMGQNLRIIPKATDMDTFWSIGFSPDSMPEDYVKRFTTFRGFSYTHLTGILQRHLLWRGQNVLLTGLLPEVMPPDRAPESAMTANIKPGDVQVGAELAASLGITEGSTISIASNTFTVIKCLSPMGSSDDIRLYANLHDVQRILGEPGLINEIRALECLCIIETAGGKIDPMALAQEQLATILPEAKVVLLKGIAEVRQRQRALTAGYLAFIMPLVFAACGAWICVQAVANVRERRREIAIMRALGSSAWRIAAMVLGKAVLIGLAGAGIGFAVGMALAAKFGPVIFSITTKSIAPDYRLLFDVAIAAPLFAVVASLVPAALAATQDPAVILSKE